MFASSKLPWALLVVMVAVAVLVRPGAAAVNCGTVRNYFIPCTGYLFAVAPSPSNACCNSIKALNNQSKGPVRRDVCNCLKSLAASIRNLNQGRAKSLSSQCHIPLNTGVSFDTDCSK
ncbi:hypothetical protein KP509_31G006300 [Ceratopteris richardii]|nr:hypothetical protein KP509_31G006300 [Ceratopteris richardii]